MKKVMKFNDGDRVKLLANEAEGWPEEVGTCLGASSDDTYIVRVDREYRFDGCDDGMREVTIDQMEKLSTK